MVKKKTEIVEDLINKEGVGFSSAEVHPLRHCLNWCLSELDQSDFETVRIYLSDHLSKAILSRACPSIDYSTDTAVNFTYRKNVIIQALEDQYGLGETLEIFKNILRSEELKITYRGGCQSMASVIEDIQLHCKHYYEVKRKEGLVIDDKFVGRKSYLASMLQVLQQECSYIKGVLICGMYGIGKTSLASQLCVRLPKYRPIYVDLRNHKTCTVALQVILNKLGIMEKPYDEDALTTCLIQMKKNVILLLDNADTLMDFGKHEYSQFQRILSHIVHLENPNVKLVITSKFKLIDPCLVSHENPDFCQSRLEGHLHEYDLQQLSLEEARHLFQHEIGNLKDNLSDHDVLEVLNFCGRTPFSIQLAARHLKNTGMSLTEFFNREPVTPITPKSPVAFFTSSSVLTDPKTQTILNTVFSSMECTWREKLVGLSIFDSAFDVSAAQAAMGCKSKFDAFLDLQYLKCCHLVDMIDYQVGCEEQYKENILQFSMHTLTQQYLNQIKQQSNWGSLVKSAEMRFYKFQRKILMEICDLVERNRLTGYKKVVENESQLKKMLSIQEKHQVFHSVEKSSKKKKVPTATLR